MKGFLRRLGWSVFTLWLVSLVTFSLLFIVPLLGPHKKGETPADIMAMTMAGAHTDPETIANIKRDRGLDKPLPAQYVLFVRDALTNNLRSYRNSDIVFSAIVRRFPNTLLLALTALSVYLVIAIPIGLFTARRAGGTFDRTWLFVCLLAVSIPTFWLGRVLQYYLGYRWDLFHIGGNASLANLPLPALTLGIGGAAYYSRVLHSNLRGVLSQDYIRAARARGIGEGRVMWRHALKNALIPLVAVLGMDFASLLSGLIFTEKIFAWPGIGSLAIDSVVNQDAPMIMGTVLFAALMVVLANIAVDLAYRIIDPRVRLD
jgi:ABC-type dipeptide/oligopeptide/nickel transport system permease component